MVAATKDNETTMTGRKRSAVRWAGLMSGAALAMAPVWACAASAADLYYERTVMTAANSRCRLFTPPVGAALAAAQAQARGAALRSGVTADALVRTAQRAQAKAYGVDCTSPDINLAAGRVRTAFEGYAKLSRMRYPGDMAGWNADRTVAVEAPIWRLSQTVNFGWDRMVFGLAGKTGVGALIASASFADGATPYTARLVMRDTTRTAGPYLDRRGSGAGGKLALSQRTPPRSATRSFTAEARSPSGPRLLPAGAKTALSFRFPNAAIRALTDLDPREAVIVEFVFQGANGDMTRQAYVEVGDFAAGLAFLDIAQR